MTGTFVITGAGGVLGGEIAAGLARAGANVALLDLRADAAAAALDRLGDGAGRAIALGCDVLERAGLERVAEEIVGRFGRINGLVNAAGGNRPAATTAPDMPFFDLPAEALRSVIDLNLLGTILPCQVFGRYLARAGEGAILNISSIIAERPLTRVPAYAAAKGAVSNFTQWLAVHMAQEYSPRIRVNAIAPGFFLTEQNRYLLVGDDGQPTPRAQAILAQTPAGRLGRPEEIVGAALWLLSPEASYVTGAVVPVDGGYLAFGGV